MSYRLKFIGQPSTLQPDIGNNFPGSVADQINLHLDTLAGQGGGTLQLAQGTYDIDSTIYVPANTNIVGVGMPTLRQATDTDNVMMVNRRFDTVGGYGADGNITIEGIVFDDTIRTNGSVATFGDCIGIGHAENVHIRNCVFIEPKFHGVDIAGSRYVTVENCKAVGGVNAQLQVDEASNNAILGIVGDSTPSQFVMLSRNHLHDARFWAFHIHNDGANNVTIIDNFIESAEIGIRSDPGTTGVENFIISRNIFKDTNNASLSLLSGVDKIIITDNLIDGGFVDIDSSLGSLTNLQSSGNLVVNTTQNNLP